jgi:hypothetical protein
VNVRGWWLLILWSFAASAQVQDGSRTARPRPFELTVVPVTAQLNMFDTMHVGFAGSFQVQLLERFGLVVGGGYNWLSQTSTFATQRIEQARFDVGLPSPSLTTWSANAGVEVRPLPANLLSTGSVKWSLVLRGLLGVVGRRHELMPLTTALNGSITGATYGEVEPAFAGTVGVGIRVQLGEAIALRLDVSDTLSSSQVDRVNGCSVDDLRALDVQLRQGLDVAGAQVSASCRAASFNDPRGSEVSQALAVIRLQQPPVAQFVQLGVGVSFLF